jgi:hypothetical protein
LFAEFLPDKDVVPSDVANSEHLGHEPNYLIFVPGMALAALKARGWF